MAPTAPNSTVRVAARLSNSFALNLVKLGGFGRDVIDGLLMAAITQANLAQINRNPELQRAYATLEQVPPDSLRRPVSISAIANSLRIPFETARRRVHALIDLGVVAVEPRGVIIPQGPLNSPLYRYFAEAHYTLVRDLYMRLRRIGLLADLARMDAPPFDPANKPVRLVARLSSNFVLRLAEPLTLHIGDLVSGLILMETVNANTEHLPDSEGGDDADWTAAGFVDDDLRRPVRPAALSERLGIPPETVRRHLRRLTKSGLVERKEDGFVVPAQVLARPPLIQCMVDNQSHLHRLYAGLAEFGVLAEWEREILALRGAA